MNLTSDQQQSLSSGAAVRTNEGGIECVIVRADVYEQLVSPLVYDDSEWTPEEMRALAARAFDDSDLAGPIP